MNSAGHQVGPNDNIKYVGRVNVEVVKHSRVRSNTCGRNSSLIMPRKTNQNSIDISLTVDDELFTSKDAVSGGLQLKSSQNIEDLHMVLTFEGSSFTCIKNADGLHTHLGRVIGKHLFLTMPIETENWPSSMSVGQASTLPFRFNIPGHMPHSCNHSINDVQLQAQHTVMPPSMVLNKRVILEDGVTVDAAKITYGIRAVIRSGGVEIGRTFKPVKFVPSSRHPPLPPRTLLAGEIMLKSGQPASKGAAKLVVENETLLVLCSPPQRNQPESILGKLDVLLRYESSDSNATPIVISKVDTKLKAITYYNARPFRSQPSIPDSTSKGYRYVDEALLASAFALGKLDWESRNPNDPQIQERIHLHPSSSMLSPLSTIFTTSISIPLALPANDNISTKFLPTFDTCIISRSYFAVLDFTFSQAQPKTKTPTTSSTSCRVPILFTTPTPPGAAEPSPPDLFSMSDHEFARLASPPDYLEHLLDDLPAYEPTDLRLVQNDGQVETFAYVKSEPWLNVHNAFKIGYKKLKGHLEVREARAAREK